MKGFTLIEALVTLSLAGIIGVGLMSLLVQNNDLFFQQSSQINQGVSLNEATSQINNVIRSASFVVSNYSDSEKVYLSDSQTLILAVPSIDQSGNILTVFDHMVIAKESSVLKKITFPNPSSSRKHEDRVLATGLAKLEFGYLDAGVPTSPQGASQISFVINLISKMGLNERISSASGQINLRND